MICIKFYSPFLFGLRNILEIYLQPFSFLLFCPLIRDVAGPMDTRTRSGWEIKNCHPDTENAMSHIRIRTVYKMWKHQLHAFINLLFHAYIFISPPRHKFTLVCPRSPAFPFNPRRAHSARIANHPPYFTLNDWAAINLCLNFALHRLHCTVTFDLSLVINFQTTDILLIYIIYKW